MGAWVDWVCNSFDDGDCVALSKAQVSRGIDQALIKAQNLFYDMNNETTWISLELIISDFRYLHYMRQLIQFVMLDESNT